MGNRISSGGVEAAPPPQQSPKKPGCKICCACPQERRARDECILLKNMDECEAEVSAFYACLLKEGFSAEEVNALKRNTKRM
ncbi:Cytochrome C oxidase copper chaperone (COX17), putative [Leishmania lindenbergi]|uniref:Cytochrome C oxidase copper chaperone (COX17) n=1 Tax=Leishmania lindenbergi TaxID=651832 RepID=A0AAW3AWL9_9TRYP